MAKLKNKPKTGKSHTLALPSGQLAFIIRTEPTTQKGRKVVEKIIDGSLDFTLKGVQRQITLQSRFQQHNPYIIYLNGDTTRSGIGIDLADMPQFLSVTSISDWLPDGLPHIDMKLAEIEISLFMAKKELKDLTVVIEVPGTWSVFDELFEFTGFKFSLFHSVIGSLNTLTVFCKAKVSGKWLDASINCPSATFSLGLSRGETINLDELLKRLDIELPGLNQIRCTRFNINGNTKTGYFSVLSSIESSWLLKFGGTELLLDNLILSLMHNSDGNSGELRAHISLGVNFDLVAQKSPGHPGWQFSGSTVGEQTIHLNQVVNHLLRLFHIQLPNAMPDVELSHLNICFDTADHTMVLIGESLVPSPMPFGEKTHKLHTTIDLIISRDPHTGKQHFSGSLEADFTLGHATFAVTFSLGQPSQLITAKWEGDGQTTLSIEQILEGMGIDLVLQIPEPLDVKLTNVIFEYHVDTQQLFLSAEEAKHGTVFLVVNKSTAGEWAAVFGLAFDGVGKLSDIPDIGSAFSPLDFVTIQSASLMVASAPMTDFVLPQLPELSKTAPPPTHQSQPQTKAAPHTLKEGPVITAVIDLSSSANGHAIMKNIHTILAVDTVAMQATLSNMPSVSAALGGRVGIPTGTGADLALSNPTLEFDLSTATPIFKLSGSIDLTINGHVLETDATLVLAETEAEVTVDLKDHSGQGLPAPAFLRGVHLDEIGIAMGVVFEPPSMELGLQGKLHIGEQVTKQAIKEADKPKAADLPTTADHADFALVLEMIEEAPNPLLFSFDIDEINLPETFTAVTDQTPPEWIKSLFSPFSITNAAFYWAESIVVLPDGSTASPGFSFKGEIDVFGFTVYGMFQADPHSFGGDAEIDPLHLKPGGIPLLSLTGDGKGVKQKQQKTTETKDDNVKQKWKTVNAPPIKPGKTTLDTREIVVINPGGADVRFGKSGIHASADVSLFDLLSSSLQVDIDEHGFNFVFQESAIKIANLKLVCLLSRVEKEFLFNGKGDFGVHLKGDIGPIIPGLDFTEIHLDVGFDAKIQTTANTKAHEFKTTIDGTFEFEGAKLNLPTLTHKTPIAKLDDLPVLIWDHLANNAEDIFSDLLDIAGQLLKAAAQELLDIGKEAAEEVERIGAAAIKEAAKLEHQAVEDVGKAAKAVGKEAADIAQAAAQALSDVADEVTQIDAAAAEAASAIVDEGEKLVAGATKEATKIVDAVEKEVAQVGEEIVNVAEEAEVEVEKIATAVADEAKEIIADAGKAAEEILNVATAAAEAVEHTAEVVFDEVADLANAAAEALEDAADAIESVFSGW